MLGNPESTVDLVFFEIYINSKWEETLEIIWYGFLHFTDKMTLYPILREM